MATTNEDATGDGTTDEAIDRTAAVAGGVGGGVGAGVGVVASWSWTVGLPVAVVLGVAAAVLVYAVLHRV